MISGLDLALRGEREIVMTRRFAASASLVFRAFTEPKLVSRWLLGPPDWSMVECQIELRVGGRFRYVWRHVDGREMGLTGIFREIIPNQRLVHTELFDEDWTSGETLVTTTFSDKGETTTATIVVLYASSEARHGAAASGMEKGVAASYAHLDAVLENLHQETGK